MPSYAMQCYKLPKTMNDKLLKTAVNFFWGGKENQRAIHWIKKESLCMSKKRGGIGLKDPECFNNALLLKQLWRMEAEPDLLMSKIFKGKYFPESSLSNARLGSRPSHVWRNLFKLRGFLEQGICRGSEGARPTWKASPTGEYSTKSGYDLVYAATRGLRGEVGESSNQARSEAFWKKLWRASVPPKIRMTVWRMFHNSLPDLINLGRRGCSVDYNCVFCGFKGESILHLCRDCWWGKEIGKTIGIDASFFETIGGNVADWIFYCVSKVRRKQLNLLLCFFWGIWTSRNNWVHDDRRWSVEEVALKIESLERQADSSWISNMSQSIWLPSIEEIDSDRVCFFCDGSWTHDTEVAGWAVVAAQGARIDGILAGWTVGRRSALECEGWALWQGMKEAAQSNQERVLFLSDCVAVIWALFSGGVGIPEHSLWLKECLGLLRNFPLWEFGHIHRDQNVVADEFCRKARAELWSWTRHDAIPRRKAFCLE